MIRLTEYPTVGKPREEERNLKKRRIKKKKHKRIKQAQLKFKENKFPPVGLLLTRAEILELRKTNFVVIMQETKTGLQYVDAMGLDLIGLAWNSHSTKASLFCCISVCLFVCYVSYIE